MKEKSKAGLREHVGVKANSAVQQQGALKGVILGNLLPLVIIFCSAILIYANTFSHDYALDDQMVIYDNKYVTAGTDSLGKILTTDAFEGFFGERGSRLISGGRYRPLSFISFAIEWELFGENPWIGHVLNTVFYGFLCCCIYLLLIWLFPSANKKEKWDALLSIAFVSTMLYTAHPIHTEVIANIKGRDEIYGFLLAVISVIYFFQVFENRKRDYFLLFLFFLLALMSKENAITFVLIIPLIAYIKAIKWSAKQFYLPYIAIAMATGLFLAMRFSFTKSGLTAHTNEILNNPFARAMGTEQIGTVFYSYLKYFQLLVFPHPLTHDYYFNQIPYRSLSDPIVLLSILGILTLIYVLIRNIKLKNEIVFGILFFLITFSIVSNLVFTVGIIMNERFVFVSSLGFCILLAWVLTKLIENRLFLIAVFISILCMYSYKTISRNFAWKDNFTLFSTDYHNSPNSAKVSTSFGGVLIDKSAELKATDTIMSKVIIDSSIRVLEHSLRIYPENSQTWLLYGNAVFAKTKESSQAIDIYKTALKLRTGYFDALYNIGILNYNRDSIDSAEHYLSDAVNVNPNHKEARELLGKIYARQGRMEEAVRLTGEQSSSLGTLAMDAKNGGKYEEALSLADRALALNPNDAEANFVKGICYAKYMNRMQDGIPFLERAVLLEPTNGYWMEDLAVAYGMSGQIKKTIPILEKVIELRPNDPAGYRNLATTYYNLGDKQKADQYMSLANQKANQ